MDLEGIMLSEISQTEKVHTACALLRVEFIEAESRMVVTRGWGCEKCDVGQRVQTSL